MISSINLVSHLLPFFTGTPGPPYNLTITDVSKTHVDLKWEAPKNDGGKPVLRYLHMAFVAVGEMWSQAVLLNIILLQYLLIFLFSFCLYIYIYIYIYIQEHLNKLECRGKVNLFQ